MKTLTTTMHACMHAFLPPSLSEILTGMQQKTLTFSLENALLLRQQDLPKCSTHPNLRWGLPFLQAFRSIRYVPAAVIAVAGV
jgi:hypothetical protein